MSHAALILLANVWIYSQLDFYNSFLIGIIKNVWQNVWMVQEHCTS